LSTELSKSESSDTNKGVVGGTAQESRDIEQLRQELQRLRLRYSDRHPDIIRLETLIAKLEEEQNSSSPGTDSVELDISSHFSSAQRLMRAQKEDLYGQLKIMEKEIQALQAEKEKTARKIEDYRQRIENGPKVEQMFVDLKRDYQMASNNYQSLLQKKLQAELAENLERTQKGEQFKILDQANLPHKPYKPNLRKLLSMGLMLAFGCGFGLAFVREYLDPTFWSRKHLESELELPVLVSIPCIQTEKERRWKQIKMAATACVLLVMSSTLLYALFILWKKSPELLAL
jgi:uncharacterized protein involved in exopolysaccharide biosynthesis